MQGASLPSAPSIAMGQRTGMYTQGAQTRIEYGDQIREYGVDRICRASACTVRLSRYNPDELCGVHARQRFELAETTLFGRRGR